MNKNRISRFALVALAAFLALVAGAASAQYPVRPIRLLLPNPPGGAIDSLARVVGPRLGEALGQLVVIDNRPGSNGNFATEAAARAAPDGYTLLLCADAQIVISPHLYKMGVDTRRDLVPIATLITTHTVLAVHAALPVRNLQEFLDYARRANPPLAYASIGNGSQHHLTMEVFKTRAKIDLLHVPYKGGGPATIAILGGEVSVMLGGNSVSPHIRAGRLRALALLTRQRTPAYPDLPTVAETYPGLEVTPWLGLFAPAALPAPVLARLRAETGKMLADPEMRERLRNLGGMEAYVTTPQEFTALIRSEYVRYGELVKAVGVKID